MTDFAAPGLAESEFMYDLTLQGEGASLFVAEGGASALIHPHIDPETEAIDGLWVSDMSVSESRLNIAEDYHRATELVAGIIDIAKEQRVGRVILTGLYGNGALPILEDIGSRDQARGLHAVKYLEQDNSRWAMLARSLSINELDRFAGKNSIDALEGSKAQSYERAAAAMGKIAEKATILAYIHVQVPRI